MPVEVMKSISAYPGVVEELLNRLLFHAGNIQYIEKEYTQNTKKTDTLTHISKKSEHFSERSYFSLKRKLLLDVILDLADKYILIMLGFYIYIIF